MSDCITVTFGWRLPDGRRLAITFTGRVAAYQANRDRRLVQLGERQTPLDDSLPPDISEAIRALPGQWIYMPGATQSGLLLPLKLGTLFGRPRYFHAADPREP